MLLAVATMALGAVLLADVSKAFNVDSWLALVAGRDVWQHGLPQHETLTALAQGAAWIDQQWLSQLASYGLYVVGGLALVGVVSTGMIVAGVGGAMAGARRLGAHPKAVMVVLPVLFLIIPRDEVRTQDFAIPLFVALVYLLAADSRSPSRRVYWCLPILALWANLHGTVTLGALLVALRGVTVAWERRPSLMRPGGAWARPLALALGAPLCCLLTPYGLSILGYYKTMLLGGTLRRVVTEWQPITSSTATTVAFCLVVAVALWSFARNRTRTTTWEKLAFLALALGSVLVIRNVLFFGLFALIVLPLSLSARGSVSDRSAAPGRGPFNALLSAAGAAALLLALLATFVRPASAIELSFQRTGVLNAVQHATQADPSLKVFAEDRFADWLLWRDPALSGRIANDVRYELLTPSQVQGVNDVFSAAGPNWKQGARGFGLIVLDRRYAPTATRAFLREPGSQVLYSDGERLVILRSPREIS